jgi:hypothetical protein
MTHQQLTAKFPTKKKRWQIVEDKTLPAGPIVKHSSIEHYLGGMFSCICGDDSQSSVSEMLLMKANLD